MRIKNKEIRKRRHRKEQVIKEAQRQLRAQYSGQAKTATPAAAAPAKSKPAPKKTEAAAKPAAPKKEPKPKAQEAPKAEAETGE